MNTITSTVYVTRTVKAAVLVEHPYGWTEEQVLAQVKERALDFAQAIQWWSADSDDTHTEIAGVALGVDESEVSDPGGSGPEPYSPPVFELTDDEPTPAGM